MNKSNELRPESIPVIGGVLACLFWFIDSAIDTFIFKTKYLYVENLFAPTVDELCARCQVIFLIMAFSLLAMYMLHSYYNLRNQLKRYKNEFEHIVEDRTNDLCLKNTLLREEIIERQKVEKKLVQLATIDPLTSIPNRRKFDDVLHYELNRDTRYKTALSLIFCDLDHFKQINDEHGHKIGDDVLKEFTHLVSSHIRRTDIFARWGGEEFVLLLPETDMATAIQMAEKLRIETENHRFSFIGNMTASFGVTQHIEGDNETTFIKRADDALYQSKEMGRNRVVVLPSSNSILRMSLA